MIEVPSEVQMLAWRSFLEFHSAVIKALESELMEDQGLSLTWYGRLIHLSEVSESRLQHQAAAWSLLLSRGGVTQLVDRMGQVRTCPPGSLSWRSPGILRGDYPSGPGCLGPGVARARSWHRSAFHPVS